MKLTPREQNLADGVRRGLRNAQIAAECGITEGTVKIYMTRLFIKLGVKSRLELAVRLAVCPKCGAGMLPAPPSLG